MAYAQSLREFISTGGKKVISQWQREGRGLTFEDYWIYVHIVGHRNYRMYDDAHWRDSDIVDKTDVWRKLKLPEGA